MSVNEQTQKDTERAKGRLAPNRATPRNEQTQKDTDKANAQTDKDSAPSASTMDQREAAAGLNLAGNDTMSGRRGGSTPSMSEREAAAGLSLAGNNTTAGRSDSFYDFGAPHRPDAPTAEQEIYADDGGGLPSASGGGITGIICINGKPFNVTLQGSIGAEITE